MLEILGREKLCPEWKRRFYWKIRIKIKTDLVLAWFWFGRFYDTIILMIRNENNNAKSQIISHAARGLKSCVCANKIWRNWFIRSGKSSNKPVDNSGKIIKLTQKKKNSDNRKNREKLTLAQVVEKHWAATTIVLAAALISLPFILKITSINTAFYPTNFH